MFTNSLKFLVYSEMVQSSGVLVRCDLHISGARFVVETITNLFPTIIPNCMNSINIPKYMKKIVCMCYSRQRGMCHQHDSRASVSARNCVISFAAKTLVSFFLSDLSLSARQSARRMHQVLSPGYLSPDFLCHKFNSTSNVNSCTQLLKLFLFLFVFVSCSVQRHCLVRFVCMSQDSNICEMLIYFQFSFILYD